MRFLLYFYIIFILKRVIYCEHLRIEQTGLFPVEDGDIALVFYLTLASTTSDSLRISMQVKQCVEVIGKDRETNSIHLIAGNFGLLKGKTRRNATLIYPNLYLYDRIGTCTVIVEYFSVDRSEGPFQLIRDIDFNTTKYYEADDEKYQPCNTPDLDPTLHCSPVDCRIKYSGARSFYNRHKKMCEEVPACIADLSRPTPDIAYNPMRNKCEKTENVITQEDLEQLENNDFKECTEISTYTQFQCHHGIIDNNTGECVCFNGWTSFLDDTYEPSLGIYHLCNVEINGWTSMNRSKIKMTGLLIAIFAVTMASKILIVMCILNMCLKYAKSSKSDVDDALDQPCKCTDEMIRDISKRPPECTCEDEEGDGEKEGGSGGGGGGGSGKSKGKKGSGRLRSKGRSSRTSTDTVTVSSSTDEIRIFVEQASTNNNTLNYTTSDSESKTDPSMRHRCCICKHSCEGCKDLYHSHNSKPITPSTSASHCLCECEQVCCECKVERT